MRARIYKPAKPQCHQVLRKQQWVLEYCQDPAREIDPLMGWTSSGDTQSQVKLRFDSKEAAVSYAKEMGIEADVAEPQSRKQTFAPAATAKISPPTAAPLDPLNT